MRRPVWVVGTREAAIGSFPAPLAGAVNQMERPVGSDRVRKVAVATTIVVRVARDCRGDRGRSDHLTQAKSEKFIAEERVVPPVTTADERDDAAGKGWLQLLGW